LRAPTAGDESEDWLLASVAEIEMAGRDTVASVEAVIASLESVREARRSGRSSAEIAGGIIAAGGPAMRRRAGAAVAGYERAIMIFRSRVVRSLVDDEQLSFSEVARRMGVSRQKVTRLYHAAPPPP